MRTDIRGGPLLVALHGAGSTGEGMAALTGLATRGPAAGWDVVFPDGSGRVWNDQRGAPRLRRREGVDDVGFLRALVARFAAPRTVLAGISNGALMSEHLARHGLVPVDGIALVAGPATELSRQAVPVPTPLRPTAVVMFSGTADPLVPYRGGPIGPLGRIASRRQPGRGMAVAADTVATDWARANGYGPTPVASTPAPSVTRLGWEAAGLPSVVLYRLEGGGHTWPGGPQYLPSRLVGPVARLDATGIILSTLGGVGAGG